MAEIFDSLETYGISRDDEAVILSTLLTGEPCLLIGTPGASKTRIGRLLAKALEVRFHAYNASCDQFEDIVGFLNMKSLGEGKVDYVETPLTIWGKQMVSVEEINRPDATVESKWLDFFGEGTMMGLPTGTFWRFATMNPFGTIGTRELGEAMVGRFSAFVYVPELVDMSTGEQTHVIKTIADTNMPAYKYWEPQGSEFVREKVDYRKVGQTLATIMKQAAQHFVILMQNCSAVERYLVRLIGSLAQGPKEQGIRIDGRRAGLLHRLILAVRSVELARANVLSIEPKSMQECVRVAVRSGLPIGVNEEGGRSKKSLAFLETCMTSLMGYLSDATTEMLDLQYELLTSRDVFRKAEMLIKHRKDLDRIVKSAVWNSIVTTTGFNSSLVGLMANQIEMVAPGTIPGDAMDGLTKLMNSGDVVPRFIKLPPVLSPFTDQIRKILDQEKVVDKIIAAHVVSEKAAQLSAAYKSPTKEDVDGIATEVNSQIKQAHGFAAITEQLLKKKS